MNSKKGSALVLALIILGIVSTISLSMALVSARERRASIGVSKTGLSYQTADEGVEKVLQAIKKGDYDRINQIPGCSGGKIVGTNYEVSLYTEVAGTEQLISCSSTNLISDIRSIKSVGTSGVQNQRAVNVQLSNLQVPFDFDGDGKSDLAVWNTSSHIWSMKLSSDSFTNTVTFNNIGNDNYIPIAGNYNRDGKTEITVWEESGGNWHVYSASEEIITQWGGNNDIPVPADYDNDGKDNKAIWRSSDGNWYIKYYPPTSTVTQFGASGDIPTPGNYDDDEEDEISVWRAAAVASWFVNNGPTKSWGTTGDIPVPGDYDGDGKTDMALWRPINGNWYILKSTENYDLSEPEVEQWGQLNDIPVPADYDGDAVTDTAIFRPSENNWYINNSSDNSVDIIQFGDENTDYIVNVPIGYDQ